MKLLTLLSLPLIIGTLFVSGLEVEGPCRYKEISVMKNLNLDSYMGVWYELERYDVPIRLNSDCIKLEMSKTDENSFESTETGFNYFEGKDYGVKANGVASEKDSPKIVYWYESRKCFTYFFCSKNFIHLAKISFI